MNKRKELQKSLKPQWVWAIALGCAIGWGAFVQPTNWMQTAGPLGAMIGFAIGAFLMMIIAVSYGFLIKNFPVSGGEFAYAFISLGRTHAFISGWFLTLGYICIVALNASALALMIKYVFPSLVENMHMYTIAGWNVYFTEIIIASIGLFIFGYLNIRGTGLSGRTQYIFAILMVAGVVLLSLITGFHPQTDIQNLQPFFPTDKTAWAAIISIVAIAPWAYVGFDAVPQAAEEFKFPSSKAFMLIIFALVFAAGIYVLMLFSTAVAAPWQEVAGAGLLWGTGHVIQQLIGIPGLIILVVALSMGIFTGLNGFILASSRLMFAMARAKIIPSAFGKLHPKYGTPYVAIIFTIIVSAFAPWFGREALIWVVDMSSIGVSIAYLYTSYTAYYLFKWSEKGVIDSTKQEVAPVKKFISLLGIIASIIFILLLLVPGSPAFLGFESRVALITWIVLGFIFYLVKRKEFNAIDEKELNYLILGEEEVKSKS